MKSQKYFVFPTLLLIFFFAQAEPFQKIISFGAFSNLRFTAEHQYGAGLQLWQEGSTLLGIFSYSQGLIGDTPSGVIEDVIFAPETGQIKFTARLTMGQHFCNVHKNGIFSQDIFYFDGVLSKMSLTGTLKHADNLHQDKPVIGEKILLRKTKDWFNPEFKNRNEWDKNVKNILKYRGPKW